MSGTSNQLLKTTLKQAGLSLTKPRLIVFELLEGQPPLTMSELTRRASGLLDRATLYRTVATFEKIGIVNRVHMGWKYNLELAETFAHHHHHLSCLSCGRLVALTEPEAEQLIENLAGRHGFSVVQHQLEIQGHCRDCQASLIIS